MEGLFTKTLNDWELEEVERFLASIVRVSMVNEVVDKLKWEETKDGVF